MQCRMALLCVVFIQAMLGLAMACQGQPVDKKPQALSATSLHWEMEPTYFFQTTEGGLFTRSQGPPTNTPIISLAPTMVQPDIDGVIGDDEYRQAGHIGPLRQLGNGMPAQDQTRGLITYDQTHLYIAWTATYQGASPKADIPPHQRDGAVYNDDSVEIVLGPPNQPLIHFIGNAAGAVYDERVSKGKETDKVWRGAWQYQTSIEPGHWTGELAIAWADLQVQPPNPDQAWLFDLCRNASSYPEKSKWCWRNGVERFVDRDYMGILRFDPQAVTVHLETLPRLLDRARTNITFTGNNRDTKEVVGGVVVLDKVGKTIFRDTRTVSCGPKQTVRWPLDLSALDEGLYTVSVCVRDTQTQRNTFLLTVPGELASPLQIKAELRPIEKKVVVLVDTASVEMDGADAASLNLTVLRVDNQKSKNIPLQQLSETLWQGDMALGDLPGIPGGPGGPGGPGESGGGEYMIQCVWLDQQGQVIVKGQRQLLVPDAPAWLSRHKLGQPQQVPAPWTDVQVDKRRITIWNRQYDFDQSALPSQIYSAGQPMLERAATVELMSDGGMVPFVPQKVQKITGNARTASVRSRLVSALGTMALRTTVEYDGLMKIDFVFTPTRPKTSIERLTLHFPFQTAFVPFLMSPRVTPPMYSKIGAVGQKHTHGLQDFWFGRFWLGDDERGVDFSFVSDQGWLPYDRQDTVQIEHNRQSVDVRIDILKGVTVTKPVRGTLLVTATPVRPWPENTPALGMAMWDGRPTEPLPEGQTYHPQRVKSLADLGTQRMMLSGYWSHGYGRPVPFDPEGMRKFADASNLYGIKTIVYLGGINGHWAVGGPEAPYMTRWERIPRRREPSPKRPDQEFMSVCFTDQNGGSNMFLNHLDRMIREYDLDGVYSDGTGWGICSNRAHGHGYVDESGKTRPTCTVLDTRRLLKRVYQLFLDHQKTPLIVVHSTKGLDGPCAPYASVQIMGEYQAYQGTKVRFPIDWYRIEMGRQWGIPTLGLNYTIKSLKHHMVNSYLCGASVIPYVGSQMTPTQGLIITASLWHALRQFDVDHAQWIPYWEAQDLVTSDQPHFRVSFYKHPTNGWLMLLGNVSEHKGTAHIQLNLQAMQLDQAPPRCELLATTAEQSLFELRDNVLSAILDKDDLMIFQIRE